MVPSIATSSNRRMAAPNSGAVPVQMTEISDAALDHAAKEWAREIARTSELSAEEQMRGWVEACSGQGAREEVLSARARFFEALCALDDVTFTGLLRAEFALAKPTSHWHPCVPSVLLWQCVLLRPDTRRGAIAFLVEQCGSVVNKELNSSHYYYGQPHSFAMANGGRIDFDVTLLETVILAGVDVKTIRFLMGLGCSVASGRASAAGFALTFGQEKICRALVDDVRERTGNMPLTAHDLTQARRVLEYSGKRFHTQGQEKTSAWFAEVERWIMASQLGVAAAPKAKVRL